MGASSGGFQSGGDDVGRGPLTDSSAPESGTEFLPPLPGLVVLRLY